METTEQNNEEFQAQLIQALHGLPKEKLDCVMSHFGYSREPFWKFLQTEQGQAISEKAFVLIESLQKMLTERDRKTAFWERGFQVLVIFIVVLAVGLLSHFGKFESSVGVLFGTLVGYLFGKKE